MSYPYGVGMPPTAPPVGAPSQVPLAPPQGAPLVGYPTAFAPPPAPAASATVGSDAVLDGPGIPVELRGRKLSDVMRVYSTLADDFISRKRQSQGQQPQQQSHHQQQAPQPQSQPQQQARQNPNGEGSDSFWQSDNPDQRIADIVRQVVNEAVQPFQQQTVAQGAQAALRQAREVIPDFAELEADVFEAVRGSSQEALADVNYWVNAADLARGRRARQNPHAAQPQQTTSQPMFGQGPNPLASVPAQSNYPQPMAPPTRPPAHSFFTEAPTAPSPYASTHSAALTPAQVEVARLAGVSPEQYAAMAALQQRGR
jgi:hypothetical protein